MSFLTSHKLVVLGAAIVLFALFGAISHHTQVAKAGGPTLSIGMTGAAAARTPNVATANRGRGEEGEPVGCTQLSIQTALTRSIVLEVAQKGLLFRNRDGSPRRLECSTHIEMTIAGSAEREGDHMRLTGKNVLNGALLNIPELDCSVAGVFTMRWTQRWETHFFANRDRATSVRTFDVHLVCVVPSPYDRDSDEPVTFDVPLGPELPSPSFAANVTTNIRRREA